MTDRSERVPAARQCDMPGCEAEAVEPTACGPNACPDHHPDTGAGPPENHQEEGGSAGSNPTPETDKPGSSTAADSDSSLNQQNTPRNAPVLVNGSSADAVYPAGEYWGAADFAAPEPAQLPDDLDEVEQWMVRQTGDKTPFAPWTDPDAAVKCNHQDHDEPTTCDECEHDARFKWGDEANYVAGDEAAEWVRMDPRLAGRVFLQQETDPFAFVDGDDVRDPSTGEVHPVFVALLEHLGATYADVSTSATGVHAYYRGEVPLDGKGQATFQIDSEPWGSNDDLPTVEVYANRHVNVTTGKHVPGTPVEVREWDADALRAILEAHGYDDRDIDHDTDRDAPQLDDHDPDATGFDDTATDVRDVLKAIDDLRPRDLPLRTRQVGTDATGWEQWDPSTYRQSSGNDSLHTPDRETFHDHKKGESFGVLKLFALEQGIISKPSDRLAGGDWWEAVDAARDAGAPIPDPAPITADLDPVAVLPPAIRDLSTATTGWDWRHAGRQEADDGDLMQEARDRTTAEITDALDSHDRALVEALPTLGKTYGAVKSVANTGEPATILTGRGNVEQYDQLKQWCAEFDLDYYTLPAFTRDCPTANGEHGEEWADTVRDWYERGATPQDIHAHAEYHLGEPLPCQRHEGQECPYSSAWRFDPDDYDVLIGHYTHAYNESEKVTIDRAVIVDEFPGDAFERALGEPALKSAVTFYLQSCEEIPFDDYTELLEERDDQERRADALAYLTDGELEPDTESVFYDGAAHADAPLAVFTILAGTTGDLGNGLESVEFPEDDNRVGVFDRGGVFAYEEDSSGVRILTPPALDYARSVVALDGTPTEEMWELSLGTRLNHRQVLTDEERAEYIRDGLNLNIVLTTEWIKPYNSADHVNVERDAALIEAVRERHDEQPGLITTRTALKEYDRADLLDFDPDDGEVTNGPVDRVQWRGDVLGSNQFAEKRVGVVAGSNHFGDGYVKKWGAYHGETVERNGEKGEDLSYGRVGDKIHTHMQEHDTLQSVMRFGRDGNGAVVYCHTNTLPDDTPLAGEARVLNVRGPGERQVLKVLDDVESCRTAEIASHPDVDVGQRQVFNILQELVDDGLLTREWDGRGYEWTPDGLDEASEHGDVEIDLDGAELPAEDLDDLSDGAVAEIARNSIYTWDFRNSTGDDSPDGTPAANNGGDTLGASAAGADPPPDAAD